MEKQQMKKNIAVGVVTVLGVSAFALWSFGVIGGGGEAANTKASMTVPDGYAHVGTQQNGSELVHTYQKAAPQTGATSQTSDEAYARYMQTLPEGLDKAIGQEFRTLSVSLQNARLYANTTGLIRQGKENLKALSDLDGKQQEMAKQQAISGNDTGLLVGNMVQPLARDTDESARTSSALDEVVLVGVVGRDDGDYAVLRDGRGRPFTVSAGQRFGDSLKLKAVTLTEVVVSDGESQRVIPVM